jgi:hypothetical protein
MIAEYEIALIVLILLAAAFAWAFLPARRLVPQHNRGAVRAGRHPALPR